MESFQVYKDMKARTNGEIYIGVVGPVRTGKSTFIKRFMDLLVLPNMTDIHAKERTQDELPQSASGTTIMTTATKLRIPVTRIPAVSRRGISFVVERETAQTVV